MNNKSKKESLPPQCLKLRIHSSILFGSSSDDEIRLPSDIVFRSAKDDFTNLDGNDNNSHDGRLFTVEENTGVSHVFVSADNHNSNQGDSKKTVDDKNSSDSFDFLTSSAPDRILVQPSIDGIDELGRRARARSEQQRQNRKGIKIIEDTSLIAEQARKEAKLKVTPTNTNSNKKRRRQKHRQQTQQFSSTNVARKTNYQVWTPDISRIPKPSKGTQSTYIQLHGLPTGSTFETVRRFFTGLIPHRILVVLSNRAQIPELDASSYEDLSLYDLQDIIYTNIDVRVLVKFDSTISAGLAVDRSGESISSQRQSHQGVADNRQDSFSIGVTKISKELALSLSKLSFDALPGVPFHDCLSGVESKLHPKVREILWTRAAKACRVPLDGEIKKANLLIETVNCEDNSTDKIILLTFAEYKRHSIRYNRLLGIQEDLTTSIPSEKPGIEASISSDPVIRLTTHACTIIDHELDRIDILLYQYRVSRFV